MVSSTPFNSFISNLPAASSVNSPDLIYVEQGGTSKRATVSQVQTAVLPSGGATGQVVTKTASGTAWQYGPAGTIFNVKDYGATGNGTTDDTTSINSAVAAFNTATTGVLYFPSGTYKVTTSLTTITAVGAVIGDAMSPSQAASQINFTSNNTALFTITNFYLQFRWLFLNNTAVSTPVSGSAGVIITSSNVAQKVDFESVFVQGFYIGVDVQVGATWVMNNCTFQNLVQYGVKVRNIVNVDTGDWCISNSTFNWTVASPVATSGLRVESSGGGKVVNTKFNGGGTPALVNGIDIAGASNTTDFQIAACSIENFTGIGVKVAGGSANCWPNITIASCEIGAFVGGGGVNAISISNDTNVSICGIAVQGTYSGNIIAISGTTANIHVSGVTAQGVSATLYGTAPDQDGSGGIGNQQYFKYSTAGAESRLTWTAPLANTELYLNSTSSSGGAAFRATNDVGSLMSLVMTGSGSGSTAQLGGDGNVVITSDQEVASGGTHDIYFRAGGNAVTEPLRVSHLGQCMFSNSANFSANNNVATVLGSIGPTGSRTTVQKWLTILDGAGNPFYIPCF